MILPALQSGPNVYAQAIGINNANVVVGYSSDGAQTRAVQWNNGIAQDLTAYLPPNVGNSAAQAINDSGQIIVTTTHGPIWDAASNQSFLVAGASASTITISDPSVTSVQAQAINQLGVVAGSAYFADGTSLAFKWSQGSAVLAAPFSQTAPGTEIALSINADGTVVGCFLPSDHTYDSAFIWKAGSSPTDLNALIDPTLGIVLTAAYGINDQGQIVASGFMDGSLTGVLLTPIASPEPTTATLLLLLAAPLLLRRRC
jgi:uncharacterized membrane protein